MSHVVPRVRWIGWVRRNVHGPFPCCHNVRTSSSASWAHRMQSGAFAHANVLDPGPAPDPGSHVRPSPLQSYLNKMGTHKNLSINLHLQSRDKTVKWKPYGLLLEPVSKETFAHVLA